MDEIKALTLWLATGTEAIAGLVIAAAVLEAAGRTVLLLFRHTAPAQADASHEAKEEVRLRLGRWLALARVRARGRHPAHRSRADLVGDRPVGGDRGGQDCAQLLPPARDRRRTAPPGLAERGGVLMFASHSLLPLAVLGMGVDSAAVPALYLSGAAGLLAMAK